MKRSEMEITSTALFDCSVAKTQTFRSTSMVNKTDDMIRVTLDMTRNDWRRMKDFIKQSNANGDSSPETTKEIKS